MVVGVNVLRHLEWWWWRQVGEAMRESGEGTGRGVAASIPGLRDLRDAKGLGVPVPEGSEKTLKKARKDSEKAGQAGQAVAEGQGKAVPYAKSSRPLWTQLALRSDSAKGRTARVHPLSTPPGCDCNGRLTHATQQQSQRQNSLDRCVMTGRELSSQRMQGVAGGANLPRPTPRQS